MNFNGHLSPTRRHRPSIVRLARKETDIRFAHHFEPIHKGRTYALMGLAMLAIPIGIFMAISKMWALIFHRRRK